MIHFSAKKPVAIFAISVGIVILGIISYSKIPINLMPDMNIPEFNIVTTWPGGTTEEIEEQITSPLERALSTTPGLRASRSQSVRGKSEIKLTFQSRIDIPQTVSELRDRIDSASLPEGVAKPLVKRFQSAKNSVMELIVTLPAPQISENSAKSESEQLNEINNQVSENLVQPLESIEGVALVQIQGLPANFKMLEVNATALAAFGLTTGSIVDTLNQFDKSIQAGQIAMNGKFVPLRITNHLEHIQDILNLGVPTNGQKFVKLRDLVKITSQNSLEDPVRYQGKPALLLQITKEAEANTVEVGKRIRTLLKELPESPEFQVTTLKDQSSDIENAVNNVQSSVLSGAILAAFIIYLLLRSPWTSFVITICIPISLLITLILMYFSGVTFNLMSLAGLALGVGMLVDNSTVVLESISEQSLVTTDLVQRAISGTQNVFGAITSSTFSTIAVFLPLVFVEGEIGFLFKDVAMTVCFSVFSSLIAALTLVPCLSCQQRIATPVLRKSNNKIFSADEIQFAAFSTWKNFSVALFGNYMRAIKISSRYLINFLTTHRIPGLNGIKLLLLKVHDMVIFVFQKMMTRLEGALDRVLPKFISNLPKSALLFSVGTFTGVLVLTQLGAELFPEEKIDRIEFTVSLDRSLIPSAVTSEIRNIESTLKNLPGIQEIFLLAVPQETNQYRFILKTDKNLLEITQQRAADALSRIPEMRYERVKASVFKDEKPFQVNIFQENLNELADQADSITQSLKTLAGITDITSSTALWNNLIEIRFDPIKLGRMQMESSSFIQTLQNFYITREIPKFRVDKESEFLKVAATGYKPSNTEELKTTSVSLDTGGRVFLEQVAKISASKSPSEILHLNRNRIANISGNLGSWDLDEAAQQAQRILASPQQTLKKINWNFGGQQEQRKESNKNLTIAFLLSILLIYLIAASQFESLKLPFVVLLAVPLSIVGVALFLILFQLNFSSLVLVGLIILAGSSVNTSLVMIDTAESYRKVGQSPFKAILEATKKRMRPIFVTTAANILGLIPMAFTFGEPGSSMQQPLAVTLIGGLVSSTVLTLLVVPSFYVWSLKKVSTRNES